ncbi:MAG: T9SS C-terminal target domain-containing protein, partial [Bacteroidetes bacterium]
HYGNVHIERNGHLEIDSGDGVSQPYIFAGDLFWVEGMLTTSSDFHHQIFGSDGNGTLIFDIFAVVVIGDDLILNAYGQTIMDNASCGGGGSFDDLYFKGTHATLCGNGIFVVPDAIRAWNDNNEEIFPSSAQTVNQICPGFEFYGTVQACLEEHPFPIELLRFEALPAAFHVQLRWETASEFNNDFFTLERSRDGVTFEAIGHLPGGGTTQQARTYSFDDYQPLMGLAYYRLKQTDVDGNFSFSDVLTVDFHPRQPSLRIYPNPRNEEVLSLEVWDFPPHSEIPLVIHNLKGQEVFRYYMGVDAYGFGKLEMPMPLPAGVYTVRALARTGWVSEKLLVH